jgi:hypothetical protein
MSFSILRWYLEYQFNHIDVMRYIDDFEFSFEWPYIQITRDNQIISLGYMNKSPQITGRPSEICIFHKYTIYRLDSETCSGNVIVSGDASLPGLNITITKKVPYTIKYQFEFDFHTMLVVLASMDDVVILEHKHVSLIKSNVLYQSIKIEIVQTIFSYTSIEHHDLFYDFCNRVHSKYIQESEPILKLFKSLPEPEVDPGKTHLALAYDVWYRGSRENQREWPDISTFKVNENSIEFPKKSNIWYTPPEGKFIGLSPRHDDNIYEYIPRIYVRDHRIYTSYLKDYIEGTSDFSKFSIPILVKKSAQHYGTLYNNPKEYNNTKDVMYLNSDGSVMMTYNHPKYIVYIDKVIGLVTHYFIEVIADAQLLDNNWSRVKIYKNGIWYDSPGPKILNIPALPWYYRQIIHDYNKLGRLENGPYMDLMHIGIVNPKGIDKITFPIEDFSELYVGSCLQTRRLLSFKFKPYVYESHMVRVTKEEQNDQKQDDEY